MDPGEDIKHGKEKEIMAVAVAKEQTSCVFDQEVARQMSSSIKGLTGLAARNTIRMSIHV